MSAFRRRFASSALVSVTLVLAACVAGDALAKTSKTSKTSKSVSAANPVAAKAKTETATETKLKTKPTVETGCAAAVRWISDAMLPLATVVDGKIVPKHDPCAHEKDSDYVAEGLSWSAIDRFGQKVGAVTQKDVTGLPHFVTASGSQGVKLFVRGPSSTSFVSYEWQGSADDRKNLLTFLELKKAKDVTFFEAKGERFAVVTTRHALTIVRKAGKKGWLRVHRDETESPDHVPYTLRAVVDVDGDGFPEVIEHFAEYTDGRGFDLVLRRDGKGAWNEVASNQDTGP